MSQYLFKLLSLLLSIFIITLATGSEVNATNSVEYKEIYSNLSASNDIELLDYFVSDQLENTGPIYVVTKVGQVGNLKNSYAVNLKKINISDNKLKEVKVYPDGMRVVSVEIRIFDGFLYLLNRVSENKLEIKKYNNNNLELISTIPINLPEGFVTFDFATLDSISKRIFVVARSNSGLSVLRTNLAGKIDLKVPLVSSQGKIISVLGLQSKSENILLSGVLYEKSVNTGWFGVIDDKYELKTSIDLGGQKAILFPSLSDSSNVNVVDINNRKMKIVSIDSNGSLSGNYFNLTNYGQFSPEISQFCIGKFIVLNKFKPVSGKTELMAVLNTADKNLNFSKVTNQIKIGTHIYRNYKLKRMLGRTYVGITRIILDQKHRLRVGIELGMFSHNSVCE